MQFDNETVSTDELLAERQRRLNAKQKSRQDINSFGEISTEDLLAEKRRRQSAQEMQEPKSILDSALETIGDAAHTAGELSGLNAVGKFAKDAYVGKQDPQYQDLEGFSGNDINDIDTLSQIARGKVGTMTDKGFSGVIKNALGDRLKGVKQDVHGQEIISYQNDKGEIVDRYINKPGLDYEDIDRVAESAVPFVFGGGLAGSIAKGLGFGLMGRAAVQGATAVGVDAGLQNQAQKDGSGEDYSYSRSALAGLGGAGGEIAGTILTRLFNGRGLVDKTTGKLTEKGKAWAKANKIDPDSLSDQTAEYLRQNIGKASDPDELAVQARALEFDIPTTRAQRTKSFDDAFAEKQLRNAQFGRDSEVAIKAFDEKQIKALNDAALGNVGGQIAPKAAGREKVTLGGDLRTGLNDIHSRSEQAETKLWSEIGPMYPEQGAFQNFSKIINKKADEAGVSPLADLSPSSAKMAEYMEGFMNGELKTDSPGILSSLYKNGEDTAISIDTARRKLLALKGSAQAGSPDARLANKLYEGFNAWIDDAAEKALIQGDDVAAYAKLKTARAFTREQHKQFAPRDKNGKLTPSAKKIAKIMEGEDSPEGVISSLFGRGSEVTQLANGTVETLTHLKRLLKPSDRSGTFDSIKMAYWVKLVQDKKGNILSPKKLANNLDIAFTNHQTALKVLFSKNEIDLIKRFHQVSKDLYVPDPNPSNSAIGVGKIAKDVTKTQLKVQSQRELFSKRKVLLSRIYNGLSKAPDFILNPTGKTIMGRATNGKIRTRFKNNLVNSGGVGAVGINTGANIEE